MTKPDFDFLRLDVAAFAKKAGELSGLWPLRQLPRLAEVALTAVPPNDPDVVAWSARGESRATPVGAQQTWLHILAEAQIELECQRCLGPVRCRLDVDRHFLFVHGEETAARLDEESDDDVLALTRSLDLRELIEDELLLALPLVPRHDICPEPLQPPAGDLPAEEDNDAPHPFAALKALKGDVGLN